MQAYKTTQPQALVALHEKGSMTQKVKPSDQGSEPRGMESNSQALIPSQGTANQHSAILYIHRNFHGPVSLVSSWVYSF